MQSNPILLRYPFIQCPSSSVINERFSLYVQILIEPPNPEITAMEIQNTEIAEKPPEVEIVLRSRSFDVEREQYQNHSDRS